MKLTETTTRIGVIGTGHLGSLHAKMLAQLPSASFVGVHDADATKAAQVADAHGVRAFTNREELLNAVDAVTIASVTSTHHQVAKACLLAGKHVLVEKPITSTTAEARELVDIAAAKGLTLQVGHIERFNPAILALEPLRMQPLFIESHRLAQFNPRGSDVAVVLDLMIHDIDLILSLVGSPVSRIDANGVAVVSDSPDIANARIQFKNGCVANVTASRISQHKMRKMRLFQHDAYISIDFAQPLAEVFRLIDEGEGNAQPTMLLGKIDQGTRKRLIVYDQPEIPPMNALLEEMRSFVACVQAGTRPVVSGLDGLQALEVAAEILKAIDANTIRSSDRA
ncbi:MAG: Gfo/Idh/MocA family oxidoreductase [Bacteroidetes bacterium]|nr:Gfo/Idh/MocA family oxidoreductase [Bacteroidota bacterium]